MMMMIVATALPVVGLMFSSQMFAAAFTTFHNSPSSSSPSYANRLSESRYSINHNNFVAKGCGGETTGLFFASASPSEDDDGNDGDAEEEYPASLTEKEIRALLDVIPIYAVTGTNQEGIVLVKEGGNENDIANFFFSSDMASSYYAPLLQAKMDSGEQVSWGVATFTLGFVWFDVLKNPTPTDDGTNISDVMYNGVEYRLVPDSKELAGAQSIYQATQQLKNAKANPNIFKKTYNQIPIFMDRQLLVDNDTDAAASRKKMMPMYFGLQDLVKSIQEEQSDNTEFKAEMNIEDLHSIIQEMQKDTSTIVDFRNVSFVPPSTGTTSMSQQQQ